MTTKLEHGLFAAVEGTRRVRGLLLPYGEASRMSVTTEPIMFARGTVTIPRDPSVVTLNRLHDRFDPIGRAVSLEDTDAGVVAEFEIAATDEGDEYLANPTMRKLSAEIASPVRDLANKIRGIGGRLVGAGIVPEGAFASAALFAIGDIVEAEATPATLPADSEPDEALTPDDGDDITIAATAIPTTVTVAAADTTTVFRPEDTEPAQPEKEAALMGVATAPNTVAPSKAAENEKDANAIFELIAGVRTGKDMTGEMTGMLAALADIKTAGGGASQLPTAGVIQPAWLGEVWADKSYDRRYIPLIRTGAIVAQDEKGFRLTAGAELVKTWAGNKTELPTGTAATEVLSSIFQRWGYAADLAREFYDIPANRPVIEAFVRKIVDSYARVTDYWTAEQLVISAGAQVDATTFPTDYPGAMGKVIQAIDLVDDTDASASFVIVAPDVWTELRYTPFEKIPQYVTFAPTGLGGTTQGTADSGRVVLVRDKSGALDAGQVLAGAREAAHFNEMPGGSPLLLDALDLAHGGIDKAAVGYTQFMADYVEGLVLVGDEPTP